MFRNTILRSGNRVFSHGCVFVFVLALMFFAACKGGIGDEDEGTSSGNGGSNTGGSGSSLSGTGGSASGASDYTYTVTFDKNGGDTEASPTTKTVIYPATTVDALPSPPTQTGCTFEGWATAPDGGTEFTANTPVTADITVYAQWGNELTTAHHTLVWIKPGTFQMGSPTTEPDRNSDETPHSVALTKGFYMGKYQVTQELYQAVIGSNPSSFTTPASGETQAKRPVEMVSWYETLVFCNKLSALEGLTPVYSISGSTNTSDWGSVPTSDNGTWNGVKVNASANGYRLPTEAEWEYACRAGTTTAYNTGASISDDTGWYNANSDSKTHEVGLKPANAWGLYDMHGNVWEWCWDWYDSYGTSAVTDPTGPELGSNRVIRGGNWNVAALFLRSAYRVFTYPWFRNYSLGFRLVRR